MRMIQQRGKTVDTREKTELLEFLVHKNVKLQKKSHINNLIAK